ncbi:transport permease protein [Bacteroidia bacterium]|nr:transport permease protein [Bacteroidia bacterium]
MRQFSAFIKKEIYHILRDKRTMLILLAMPIILIILFGYAITTDIKSAPMAVLDHSFDKNTTKMIERLQASEYFDLYKMAENMEEIQVLFRQGAIRMAIIVSPAKEIQLLADATNPNEATSLVQYATAIINSSAVQPLAGINIRLLYNPQMKGSYNFVPGIMGLLLILICAMMTSVGIVKEKEMGTMEVLLVSPMNPFYIVLAKAAPYLMLSIINIATILLLSRFLLGVPLAGSVALVVGLAILYALVSLCLGLLISTLVSTQQAAMLSSGVVLMLPVMMLSGMIFPVENMPRILQLVANIIPAKWFISAVKDVMIKGLGAGDILPEIGVLCLMVIGLAALSVKRFKIRL